MTRKTTKTAAVQAKLQIVKSAPPAKEQPPAPKAARFIDFDDCIEIGKHLNDQAGIVEDFESELDDVIHKRRALSDVQINRSLQDFNAIKKLLDKFEAAWECFENPALYDWDTDWRGNARRLLKRLHVAEQISLLLGSYANTTPHNPQANAGMTIELIIAAKCSAAALEAACREILRTSKKFAPSPAELLEVLKLKDEEIEEFSAATDLENWEWWFKRMEAKRRAVQAMKPALLPQKAANDA
jgi:hypothetical protein